MIRRRVTASLPPLATTLKPSNHPYLTGAWTPLTEEVTATDLEVLEGAIPADLDGLYIRNTENQVHQPLGRRSRIHLQPAGRVRETGDGALRLRPP